MQLGSDWPVKPAGCLTVSRRFAFLAASTRPQCRRDLDCGRLDLGWKSSSWKSSSSGSCPTLILREKTTSHEGPMTLVRNYPRSQHLRHSCFAILSSSSISSLLGRLGCVWHRHRRFHGRRSGDRRCGHAYFADQQDTANIPEIVGVLGGVLLQIG